jgi:inosine-uridine nucleoside N-ribohydrolase
VEAAGGLIWLTVIAALVSVPPVDVDQLGVAAIAGGAGLATLGLAGQRWTTLGRLAHAGIVIAALGCIAIAPGAWPEVLLGLLAIPVGTLLVAITLLRGPDRHLAAGLALLAACVGAASLFAGPQWFAAAFGLGHLIVAALGIGPLPEASRPRRWPVAVSMAGASFAALAVVIVGAAVAAGQLRLPSSVTASIRTGPLPAMAIVIDTDMQPDDWLAILYLASEPDVDIRAVTVAGGSLVGCEAGVDIARHILADVGLGAVPVACGPSPAAGGTPFPLAWLQSVQAAAGRAGWGPGAIGSGAAAGRDGVALLRNAVDAGPVTILSLGPPTNIARLFDDPSWDRGKIVRIVQMAGAVDVPGNVQILPLVEWNAAVDPSALAAVLAAPVDVVLVSLDGTKVVPIRPADIDRMTRDRSTRAASLAAQVLDAQRGVAATGQYYAWDPLAAVIARQLDAARLEAIPVRVMTDSGRAGRTIRDPAGKAILVTVDADAAGFERIFLDALLGRAR